MSVKLTEKKLNLMQSVEKKTNVKEISEEDLNKAIAIEQEILGILSRNKCTVNEAYVILASMVESIYAYSILKDFEN